MDTFLRFLAGTGLILVVTVACKDKGLRQDQLASVLTIDETGNSQISVCGEYSNGFFAYLESEKVLRVWRWDNSKIIEGSVIENLDETQIAFVAFDRYVRKSDSGIDVIKASNGVVIEQILVPFGWYLKWIASSRNGNYVAFVLNEDAALRPQGHEWGKFRIRAGLCGPDYRETNFNCVIQADPDGMNIRSICPSNDGRLIAIGGWNCGAAVIDIQRDKLLWSLRPSEEICSYYVVFSPNCEQVYFGGVSGVIFGCDSYSGEVISRWRLPIDSDSKTNRQVTSLYVSHDGDILAVTSGNLVYILDTRSGALLGTVDHGENIYAVSMSPETRHLATLSNKSIKTWKFGQRAKTE